MKLNKAVAIRIKEILRERKITQYELYKLTGVPQSTISTILKCECNSVRLSTIYDICSGLGIELKAFFDSLNFSLENLTD